MEQEQKTKTAMDYAEGYAVATRATAEKDIAYIKAVAEMISTEGKIGFSTSWDSLTSKKTVDVWPESTEIARKVVGSLIRAMKTTPVFQKWAEDRAEARFPFGDILIRVNSYQGANCRLVEIDVVIPAEPERVVASTPERIEKKLVMECNEGAAVVAE